MIPGEGRPWRRRLKPFEHDEPAFTLVPAEPVEEETEYSFPDALPSPLPTPMGLPMLDEELAEIIEGLDRIQQERQLILSRVEVSRHIVRDMQNRWRRNL